MPSKQVIVNVDYKLDFEEISDWVEHTATDKQKQVVYDLIKDDIAPDFDAANMPKVGQIVPDTSATVMEQIAIEQLNEILAQHGAEYVMDIINNRQF